MPTRDYYLVLGVPRTESPRAIRAAFRERAKQIHPDHIGGDEAAFRELLEAYECLADPARRRTYDADGVPVRSAEPLVNEPVSVFGDVESVRPSFDELFSRWSRNFTGIDVPKAERVQALDFELILTPEEAERGGVLPLVLPRLAPCRRCGGTGEEWLFHCQHCAGTGVVEARHMMQVMVPAGVRPGSVLQTPLVRFGVDNLYLRLRVRVGT